MENTVFFGSNVVQCTACQIENKCPVGKGSERVPAEKGSRDGIKNRADPFGKGKWRIGQNGIYLATGSVCFCPRGVGAREDGDIGAAGMQERKKSAGDPSVSDDGDRTIAERAGKSGNGHGKRRFSGSVRIPEKKGFSGIVIRKDKSFACSLFLQGSRNGTAEKKRLLLGTGEDLSKGRTGLGFCGGHEWMNSVACDGKWKNKDIGAAERGEKRRHRAGRAGWQTVRTDRGPFSKQRSDNGHTAVAADEGNVHILPERMQHTVILCRRGGNCRFTSRENMV